MTCVYTALVTPFKSDGSLDLAVFEKLIETQMEAGVHGLVVCGSTGEGMTLSDPEKELLLKTAVARTQGRIAVMMGAGHANTQIACLWQKKSQDLGASHTLHVTPWYSKPPADGLFAHYAQVAQVNKLPIILYNVPGRTQCNLPVPVILRLAQDFSHIKGLKECNLEPVRLHTLLENLPKDFQVFSGEDAFILPLLAMGGHGVISVWSNLVPQLFVDFLKNPNPKQAAQIAFLSDLCPGSPNPIPIKTALGLNYFRLPLCALPSKEAIKLREVALTPTDLANKGHFKTAE